MPAKGADPVWSMVMFDVPTKTDVDRRNANRFRHFLVDEGFGRVQLSVYAQYYPNGARAVTVLKKIKQNLPPGGDVRILHITDKQWSTASRFSRTKAASIEEKPEVGVVF
ncbi:CRISPR-associated endonuclease Cas2 [Corynebacterium choanae]